MSGVDRGVPPADSVECMGAIRKAIDPGLLRRLYLDEAQSSVAIGARLGCADQTILRRLRRTRIRVRPRGPIPRRRAESIGIDWSPATAYAVGLMATDGNLSGRKGHLSLISKDVDQIETFRRCLRLEVPISQIRTATGIHHKVLWCDRGLYDWFVGAGLTPAKSRTLGPLAVPDSVFRDFFRGCIDGDGSVLVYIDRYHAARRPQYVYERLYVSLVSASLRFLDWIKASVGRMVCVGGAIHRSGPRDRPLVDAALRQGRIDTAHRLDVLFAGRSRRWSQARQGREISNAAGLCLCAFSRTTESRVVVHWPGLRHVEGSGPGWCNGSHAGLKIQCP